MSKPLESMTAEEKVAWLLEGAVDCVRPEELLAKLQSGKRLTIKAGFDPTAPDIHLGHTVLMHKMKQFQQLGHEVIFVVGDFTTRIGDPSGRSKTRPALSIEQIEANAETYRQQAVKVLDPEKTSLRYNSEWLGELGADGIIRLAARYTVARMLERDDFEKRYKANLPISIHELLYPLAQAYDSVALQADVELGGTDQTFNLLVGRDIMREYDLAPQVILTTPLLVGLDGVDKMSKSLGNYVAIEDPPSEMYGKLMSISDDQLWPYHRLLTELSDGEVETLRQEVADDRRHPMRVKQELARRITASYHGAEAAEAAEAEFERIFRGRQRPTEVEERSFPAGEHLVLATLLAETGLASSRSEARRLIAQGGVQLDGERFTDPRGEIAASAGRSYDLKVGKRRFLKVRFD